MYIPSRDDLLQLPLRSVHHPKESSFGVNHAKVFEWKQRIQACLSRE